MSKKPTLLKKTDPLVATKVPDSHAHLCLPVLDLSDEPEITLGPWVSLKRDSDHEYAAVQMRACRVNGQGWIVQYLPSGAMVFVP